MSLLNERMQECTVIDITETADNEGGVTSTYTNGRKFNAAIVFDTKSVETAADARTLKRNYTIITPKGTGLVFHEVIKDKDDNYYRITSNGSDRQISEIASFQVEAVTAEHWEVETDD